MKNNDAAFGPASDASADASVGLLAPSAESQVSEDLIRSLLHAARGTHWLAMALSAAIVVLGWSDLPRWQLLGWFALTTVLALYRWAIGHFYQRDEPSTLARQQLFFKHHDRVWLLSGLVWGLVVLMFLGRTPMPSEFIVWLVLSGVAAYSVICLALRPQLVQRYLGMLLLTRLGSLAFCIAQPGADAPGYLYGFGVLAIGEWWLLRRVGFHLFQSHRNNAELLRHNQILIDSLTQQRQAALSAVATRNRLLASAAHDMRQPVLALSLYADWLRNEPEAVHEIAPKIVLATRAVNALFESLFELARFDSEQVKLHIEPVPIGQLLRDLELQHRPVAEARGLKFRVNEVTGELLTDPVQVRRIIGNLLSNAIKYTETGGVLLAARKVQSGVRIEVWDTGIGIAPEHLNDVFLEFYRVPELTRTSDGFGLGLSIVARLSGALGHPVTVRSRLHRGSVFGVGFSQVEHVAVLRRSNGA